MKDAFLIFPWSSLLEWYREHGRHDLEWREYSMESDIRAYRIWLSEIFLQQTQVERVRGYFTRILEAYPCVHDLAEASYEEFFPYYQGMGYYSRARNLLATARIISSEYVGVFPEEKSLLQKLPGVGGYTSSAILAFAYGKPYLAWDTNLEKVFARYYHGSRLDRLTETEKNEIEEHFRDFINSYGSITDKEGVVRAINNALMDFAATVDMKNPDVIDWMSYPIKTGLFYETKGSLEPRETKKSQSFPTPDATVIVILHKDHKIYYSDEVGTISYEMKEQFLPHVSLIPHTSYLPFLLPPSLTRDTRKHVQDFFRKNYGLELSVRPAHKKWISEDGQAYIAVNAQVQVGEHNFIVFQKK